MPTPIYKVTKSIDIDFGHHVSGHQGACINLHGHTWKFEVVLASHQLDATGFVVDFKDLKTKVLQPMHDLLDHSTALGEDRVMETFPYFESIGIKLLATRPSVSDGEACAPSGVSTRPARHPQMHKVNGAYNLFPGGMKMAVFPYNPTSERLAQWAYELADERVRAVTRDRVWAEEARVYETLHPVQSIATFGLAR